ncbi:hypothetical protein GNY06_05035 [Elizabethkingia argentiflava]|uniref:Terminase small subunit protein n=1 Tax=Elizabethkingia argenteiflava TaxID=2681556 RepID=A0A845PRE2_9FLAO|nr:hypothetical protein [Elizabethkingia argenteiflava]NAW50772.1 hypothetical protein [Elizabethkingia argenteiflava]
MSYPKKKVESIFEKIITEIAENNRSVRSILKDEGMPSMRTFFKWLKEDEEKVKQYEISCEIRAASLFDEMMDIAYNTENGTTEKIIDGERKEIITSDMLGHRRLKIDTIKWALSKMMPKKYGDKLDVTSKGDKLESESPTVINFKYVPPPDEE